VLARLRGWGFVVDVLAVKSIQRPSCIKELRRASCIGEGEPPVELLIAAVACAGSIWTATGGRNDIGPDIPVKQLRDGEFEGGALELDGVLDPFSLQLLTLLLPASKIATLSLDANHICGMGPYDADASFNVEGLYALCAALRHIPTLTALSINDNCICGIDQYGYGDFTNKGLDCLCEGVQDSAVTSLSLKCNELCGRGGSSNTGRDPCDGVLANATYDAETGSFWDSDYGGDPRNKYTLEGVKCLCAKLQGTRIAKLDVSGNNLNEDATQMLKAALGPGVDLCGL